MRARAKRWVQRVAGFGALALVAAAPAPGEQRDVVFTEVSPLSSNAELLRRALSPIAAAQVQAKLDAEHAALADQPVDPTRERFTLVVPPTAPEKGYGLIVFVSPLAEAEPPPGWAAVLARRGMIFTAAERSGNDQQVVGRREPLAILAAVNAMRRYPVDPARVYIGGISGGARVAMKLALAYPDLFKGALLNAGSDPIGELGTPIPPRSLFEAFQAGSRLVYVTGTADEAAQADDAASQRSMKAFCVFDVAVQPMAGAGHEAASPAQLDRALATLDAPAQGDAGKLAACRQGLDAEIAARLDRVEALLTAGKRGEAAKLLADTDRRYGGLAAPRSVELWRKGAYTPD
ncbi:MAG TPA: PHB depolymerase family esterase [Caulobacteraceae bacterium]|nr:PHB depolymerase family esterase [Caulobacteraceae bacterium]